MKFLNQQYKELRAKRVDRILNAPNLGWLETAWAKRGLSVVTVIGSWVYLFLINPLDPGRYWPEHNAREGQLFWIGAILIASFLLLRASLRRVTSVPAEYLDERQLADRDWAFRWGYLVIRMLGLVLTFGLVITQLFNLENLRGEVASLISVFFANSPVVSATYLIGLLTYTAFAFPLVLLAWREAKHVDMESIAEQDVRNLRFVIGYESAEYFKRLRRIAYLMAATLAMMPFGNDGYRWIGALFFTIGYAVYVFFWGLLKHWHIMRLMKTKGVEDEVAKDLQHQQRLFLGSAITGTGMLSLVIAAYTLPEVAGFMLSFLFFGGIGLLGFHVATFATLRSLATKKDLG